MAAATISPMAMLNAKCFTAAAAATPKIPNFSKQPTKPISLLSSSNPPQNPNSTLAGTAFAGAIFSALSSSDPALAVQQIAVIAEGGGSDNRGLALLLPIIPAIGWVLFNILQPALNQINRMRSSNGVVIGLGLGGLAAVGGLVATPHAAAAGEVAMMAEAAGDNRGQLLLFVIAPAILWVLYNILQPALNQLSRMRSQ